MGIKEGGKADFVVMWSYKKEGKVRGSEKGRATKAD